MFFDWWIPPRNMGLDDILEQPNDFFLNQASNTCIYGVNQPINLKSIDFSQPDGEFIYNKETYQLKSYLDRYFFRNQNTHSDFIYSFNLFGENTVKQICEQKHTSETIEQLFSENITLIQRCIQYENTIFCFAPGIGSVIATGEYCSLKSR